MATISELFDVYGLAGHDKQRCFWEVIEDYSTVALRGGRLTFGDKLSFPIELIGTHSNHDNTWMWTWANPRASSWSPAASRRIYDHGLAHNVPELIAADKFALDDPDDAHALAKIAVGILNADCYYRYPWQDTNGSEAQGQMFFVIPSAPEVRARADFSAVHVVGQINEFLTKNDSNHRVAVGHYLRSKGYHAEGSDRDLTATSNSGETLTIHFDSLGRVAEMAATVTGSTPSSGNESRLARSGNASGPALTERVRRRDGSG